MVCLDIAYFAKYWKLKTLKKKKNSDYYSHSQQKRKKQEMQNVDARRGIQTLSLQYEVHHYARPNANLI